MSLSEFPKCFISTESNIPIPKRLQPGKKVKPRSEFPELQRYIESIIRASNDYDSDVSSFSDKKDKHSKARRVGKHSLTKVRDSEKQFKLYEPYISTPKKDPAVVSTRWEVGCKLEDAQKRNPCEPKLNGFEKYLKKLYPNPYALDEVVEFKNLKSGSTFSKGTDSSDSGTHPDHDVRHRSPESKNCKIPVLQKDKNLTVSEDEAGRKSSDVSVANKLPVYIRTISRKRDSSSPSRLKSSLESLTAEYSPKKTKKRAKPSESEQIRKSPKIKPTLEYDKSDPNDYDIGKLKLLNLTDSDDSSHVTKSLEMTEAQKEETSLGDDFEETKIDSPENDIYKTRDLNDLHEIYDVMNKATESFLVLISQSEKELEASLKIHKTDLAQVLNDKNDPKDNPERAETEEEKKSTIDPSRSSSEVGNSLSSVTNPNQPTSAVEITSESSGEKENCKRRSVSLDDLGQKPDSDELQETSQKIDEVLQFMYDCLVNFTGKDKQQTADIKTEKLIIPQKRPQESTSEIKPKIPHLSKANSYPCARGTDSDSYRPSFVKEIQSECSQDIRSFGVLKETNRKSITRTRCRRRPTTPENFCRSLTIRESDIFRLLPSNQSTYPTIENQVPSDSPQIYNGSTLQTVESHNELGGFAETQQDGLLLIKESKSILPLSVKMKKSKTDTCKVLKTALETEEKLLAQENPPTGNVCKVALKKPKSWPCEKPAQQLLIKRSSPSPYSIVHDLKRQNSNFVICLNPLPRNLRTITNSRTKMCFSSSVSISLGDAKMSRVIKPLSYSQTCYIENHPVPRMVSLSAREYSYRFKEEILRILSKADVSQISSVFCTSIVYSVTTVREENSLKTSECRVDVDYAPTNHDRVEPANADSVVIVDKPVQALEIAVEHTEESLFLLEHNEPAKNIYRTCESLSCSSGSENLKNEISETNWEGDFDKKKVHDLLLRTYNLQRKLQRYLHRMTSVQPSSLSCPLIHQETYFDISVLCNEPTNPEIIPYREIDLKSEHSPSLVYWYLQTPEIESQVNCKVQKIDHSTSYHPPLEDKPELSEFIEKEVQVDDSPENDDDDDRSSTYSFKSSNDFSEPNSTAEKDLKPTENLTGSKQFFKKIFNEIELFKKSLRMSNQEEKNDGESRKSMEPETAKNNELIEYNQDVRAPAKVLKTVFKGKDSLTELSIGLKDVPMTNVSNISVEKKKYSPNHTKISICISKEKPEKSRRQESSRQGSPDILPRKLSSYYLDDFRPSLSTCEAELSRLDNDLSKSSGSTNEESEEDEDDYKSVMSTLSNSETNLKDSKPEEKEVVRSETGATPRRTYQKHRFDFYRKMDSDFTLDRSRNRGYVSGTMYRYKELEPLRQALTEMQIRMRSIKRDSFVKSNEYYDRALKLAKMSAGYCQACGSRSVIPEDTFGYYRNLLPRRCTHHSRSRHIKNATTPKPSLYSFRSSNPELSDHFYDISSSYTLKSTPHPGGAILRSSYHDLPILLGRM